MDEDEVTPLISAACRDGDLCTIQSLLLKGARLDTVECGDRSAYYCAKVEKKSDQILNLLSMDLPRILTLLSIRVHPRIGAKSLIYVLPPELIKRLILTAGYKKV